MMEAIYERYSNATNSTSLALTEEERRKKDRLLTRMSRVRAKEARNPPTPVPVEQIPVATEAGNQDESSNQDGREQHQQRKKEILTKVRALAGEKLQARQRQQNDRNTV